MPSKKGKLSEQKIVFNYNKEGNLACFYFRNEVYISLPCGLIRNKIGHSKFGIAMFAHFNVIKVSKKDFKTYQFQLSERYLIMTDCYHNRVAPPFKKIESIPGSIVSFVGTYLLCAPGARAKFLYSNVLYNNA